MKSPFCKKYGLPNHHIVMPLMLRVMQQKEIWTSRELAMATVEALDISAEQKQQKYNLGDEPVMINRAMWALSDLRIGGLVETASRGVVRVTPLGRALFEQHGENFTHTLLYAQEKYIAHGAQRAALKQDSTELKQKNSLALMEDFDQDIDPFEAIHTQVQRLNDDLSAELFERILNESPVFFEHLCAKLLVAMGYKGTHGSAIVTKASGDGGIDCMVSQDALGTSTVYVQAKRYAPGNTVSRNDIDTFYGALRRIRASCGVFITTSSFSSTAEEAAKGFSIVTIDGAALIRLCLKYYVGVRPKQTLTLYMIDEDFFEE